MSAISAIQAMKRELRLEEDDYRAMLERVTGQNSLRLMSSGQLGKVMDEMRAKGGGRRQLKGDYAPRLQALWIACWNLGMIENHDDKALLAFVARQTGIERTEWLLDATEAAAVIEALKAMLARAGVDWRVRKTAPAWARTNGYRVAAAQFELARKALPAIYGAYPTLVAWMAARLMGEGWQIETMAEERHWHVVMNALGQALRNRGAA